MLKECADSRGYSKECSKNPLTMLLHSGNNYRGPAISGKERCDMLMGQEGRQPALQRPKQEGATRPVSKLGAAVSR